MTHTHSLLIYTRPYNYNYYNHNKHESIKTILGCLKKIRIIEKSYWCHWHSVNGGSVWYLSAPPLGARGFTRRRCRSGEIWRSGSVSPPPPPFFFCFFFNWLWWVFHITGKQKKISNTNNRFFFFFRSASL